MDISKLKKELRFHYRNENGDKKIKGLKEDLKILKAYAANEERFIYEMRIEDYSGLNLSPYNYNFFTLAIDKDIHTTLDSTRKQLRDAFNERFYIQRAAKFLDLTGNILIDSISIKVLEDCRTLLLRDEATEDEVFNILPSNHKFTRI